MKICDRCIHADVCGEEGAFDEALTYCGGYIGWISVSERLPEEMGTYITTLDYGEYGLAVGQRYYYGKGLGWAEEDCVIAWMPLPKPYEIESEEKKC